MKYKILKTINGQIWNEHLLLSKSSTFFQTYEFLTSNNENKFPIFIYVLDDNEKIKAQLGISITQNHRGLSGTIFKKLTEIASKLGNRGSWVSGPIIHSNDSHERIEILQTLFSAIEEITKDYNLILIDGYTPPQDQMIDENYKKIFQKNNYTLENFLTFSSTLDLSIEELWKKIKKNAKNDVNKAKRENISVKEIKTLDEIKEYKLLAQIWAKTKGISINNPLENLEKELFFVNSGIQKFFVAYEQDKIVAGLRIGCFNGIAYTHQVLNSYSKTGNVAGPLLTWHAIEWAKNNNLRIYDFSGGKAEVSANKSIKEYSKQWDSLFAYKKKWGGEQYPYFHFIKVTNNQKYKLFRLLSKPDSFIRNYKKNQYQISRSNKNDKN